MAVVREQDDLKEAQATKLTLIGIFLGLLAAFAGGTPARRMERPLGPFDLIQIGLAAYRAGRMTAYERVAAPLRAPFTETRPDASGAGETVVARGSGVRRALGELFSCPVCLSTWVAAGLVYGSYLAPRPTRVVAAILSATGISELTYAVSEALSWTARAARRQAGS